VHNIVDRTADQIESWASLVVKLQLCRQFVIQLLIDFFHFIILHVPIWTSSNLFRILARTLSLLSHFTGYLASCDVNIRLGAFVHFDIKWPVVNDNPDHTRPLVV